VQHATHHVRKPDPPQSFFPLPIRPARGTIPRGAEPFRARHGRPRSPPMPSFPRALPALAAAAMASSALAGGSPEHVLLIINPARAESMDLGHYYKHARNIPDANVLYLDPGAASYAQFAGPNGGLDGFFGALRNGALSHIDYVVVANTRAFYISAPGYVT